MSIMEVRRVPVLAILAAVLSAAVGIATNKVTENWSSTWLLTLGALLCGEVAVATRRTRGSEQVSDDAEAHRRSRRSVGRQALFSLALLGLIAVVGLIWLVPRGPTECIDRVNRVTKDLRVVCRMARWEAGRIPIFTTTDGTGEDNHLFRESSAGGIDNMQGFICQKEGSHYPPGGSRKNKYWALTVGDEKDRYGFVPQYFFEYGEYGKPANNLPMCSESEKDKSGQPAPRPTPAK